ncbi:hypothetical protein AZI86_12680 [Bdellovibrio bacteriovorus]|uniref:CheR-type methyltransferase domain-containing protein n=1 Tax=Bdellovibrio bacteriovorus TaxID=959 RepID=A0A150WIV2_BDEBC|nr:protein-glutamate O-methyltransferase CheR [Bdellovibrio bacteriovorus]KYG63679.1 hypothetical protein AZI86_12680 [Bdellovibrio bacteriovorus]
MIPIDPVERHLFFEGILIKYGYDFRQYAEASLDRRLAYILGKKGSTSLLDLLKDVLGKPEEFRSILSQLTINTTEFFRDPHFFKTLRETVIPILKTYPHIVIWSAGCSTGEEVLSLAILLQEENLLKRTTIYATDINQNVLKTAKEGIYEASCIPLFNKNYSMAGGSKAPSDYYSADYGLVRFNRDLLENVVFSEHNLATDSAFVECQLILCRNVFIYFSRELQNRALELFCQSLAHKGFLAIGPKETLRFSPKANSFSSVHEGSNIFSFNERFKK